MSIDTCVKWRSGIKAFELEPGPFLATEKVIKGAVGYRNGRGVRSEEEIRKLIGDLKSLVYCSCGKKAELEYEGNLVCPDFVATVEEETRKGAHLTAAIRWASRKHPPMKVTWYEVGMYDALLWALGEMEVLTIPKEPRAMYSALLESYLQHLKAKNM